MRPRNWTSFAVLSCLLAVTALALVTAADEVTPPPVGNLFINQVNSPATITSRTVFVNGAIIVDNGGGLTITDSVVMVNTSVVVNSFGSLAIVNSTLLFNCTPLVDNFLRVQESGTLTISDRDANRETTADRSVITSATSFRYNITVLAKANVRILESLVSKAGRHIPMGDPPEGVQIKADNAEIRGTLFEECFTGLTIDSAEKVRVSNCTFDRCEYAGIFMRGVIQATIEDCTVTRGLNYGIFVRGFMSKTTMNRCTVLGNANTELELVTLSGDGNSITSCTFGPSAGVGVHAMEAEAITMVGCTVTRCGTGVDLTLSTLTLIAVSIDNCTTGFKATSGTYTLEDLSVLDTTASVEPAVVGNVTCKTKMRIDRSRLDLGRFLVVKGGGVLNVTNTTLSFRLSNAAPTGIVVEAQGALGMADCVVGSPVSRLMVFRLMSFSIFELRTTTISNIGTPSSTALDKGLYIAGGGLISDIVVQDGEHGLVVGRTQARVVGVTVRRCNSAVMSDGQVGPGGMVVERLSVEDCGRVAVLQNDGSLTIVSSDIAIGLEGFNLTRSLLNVRDSALHAPTTGGVTAFLTGRSTVNFFNSTFTDAFGWGTGENEVHVNWYLTMSFTVLEPAGAPLVNGTVSIRNAMGLEEVQGLSTGPMGRPARVDLRERTITSDLEFTSTPHTITVTLGDATDALVETMDRNRDVSLALDTTPPSVSITGVIDGGLYNASTFRILVEGADPVHRVAKGPWRIAIRVDNGTWDEVITTGYDLGDWAFAINLTDGPHLVEAYVRDASGNRGTASVSFSVDTTPPEVTILYPPQDLPPQNRTSVTVLGTTDPGANLTIDGEPVAVGPTGTFSHTVALEEGPNRITLVVADDLGNRRVVHIDITVDTTPPMVAIDPIVTPTNASTVRVTGTKEMGATLYVNGPRPNLTDAEQFDVLVALEEGPNQVYIESADGAGNGWHTTLTVLRDSTAPSFTVVPPPAQTRYAMVTIQGTTEPGATVAVNGLAVIAVDGAFSAQVILQVGLNTITVEARDGLWNRAEPAVYTVTLDVTAPALAITSLRQVTTDLDHTQLNGTTDPSSTYSVLVTYGAYSKTYSGRSDAAGAFIVRVELPQIGSHSVVVTVEDAAGNTATETLTYERVFPKPIEPDGGDGDGTWLEDNWVYLVLLTSIVLGAAVLLIAIVPSRRQREARRKLAEARAARASEAAAAADAAGEALEEDTDAEAAEAAEGTEEEGDADGPDVPGADGGTTGHGWEEMPEGQEGEPEVDEAAEQPER